MLIITGTPLKDKSQRLVYLGVQSVAVKRYQNRLKNKSGVINFIRLLFIRLKILYKGKKIILKITYCLQLAKAEVDGIFFKIRKFSVEPIKTTTQ